MDLKKKIDHLHIIRGVASLLVVFFHARFILWCGGTEYLLSNPGTAEKAITFSLMTFFSSGEQMVICFFVLSGFFLKISYEKNKTGQFYYNRFIRIYLPYIANSILACGILYVCLIYINTTLQVPFDPSKEIATRPVTAFHDITLTSFLKSMIFLPDKEYIGWNFQYWSLLYEGVFYLTIPLLMFRKKIVLMISALTYLAGFFYSPDLVILKYVFNYLLFFQMGIYLHNFMDHSVIERFFVKGKKWLLIGGLLVAYLIMCALAIKKYIQVANLLGGILAIFVILMLYHRSTMVVKSRFYKELKKLGDISFSLYLNHVIVLYLIYAVFTRMTGRYIIYKPFYLLAIPLVVAVSYIFYLLVEKQSLRLKNLRRR